MVSSLSANLAASALGCEHNLMNLIKLIQWVVSTFPNIQIPDWPSGFDLHVRDTFEVRQRDLAHFEVHRCSLIRQLLEEWSELGQEGENITGVALVADSANFEHLDARHGSTRDSFLSEDSGCA